MLRKYQTPERTRRLKSRMIGARHNSLCEMDRKLRVKDEAAPIRIIDSRNGRVSSTSKRS